MQKKILNKGLLITFFICQILFSGCGSQQKASVNRKTTNLFPIYGISLGTTSIQEIQERGYICKDNNCNVETLDFWDHDSDGIVESIYTVNSEKMPDKWIESFGFRWDLSYTDWMKILKKQGFKITVEKQPHVEIYSDRKTLSALFKAYSEDQNILLELSFNYGNDKGEGYDIHARYSLYSIRVTYL